MVVIGPCNTEVVLEVVGSYVGSLITGALVYGASVGGFVSVAAASVGPSVGMAVVGEPDGLSVGDSVG